MIHRNVSRGYNDVTQSKNVQKMPAHMPSKSNLLIEVIDVGTNML